MCGGKKGGSVQLDEGEIYDKIARLLRGGKDISTLKLKKCKTYLRRTDLRVTGSKAICLDKKSVT